MVDDEGTPLPVEVQFPRENATLQLHIQLPALSLPVDASTANKWTQTAHVNITDVLPTRGRFGYVVVDLPSYALTSKRWTSVMDLGNGKTLYESREVFYGPIASVLKFAMQGTLNDGFEGMAKGLKMFVENGK
jgi:hypothetical protein